MATKLAKNGTYMEYLVIRPTFGFEIGTIANAILMYHDDVEDFKKKYKTWNVVMARAKYIILEEGLNRLDYAFENIEDYNGKYPEMVIYLQSLNPKLGSKKQG